MIIVKLKGGLGNQMFQYAAARAISKKKSIIIDLTHLTTYRTSDEEVTSRNLELKVFKNLKALVPSAFFQNIFMSEKLFYNNIRKLFFTFCNKIIQNDMEYVDIIKSASDFVFLDGYFQSERYFSHLKEQLLHEFSFPELDKCNAEVLRKINLLESAVSIHVRRSDYLKAINLKVHGIMPIDYYESAIQLINNEVKNAHYFIFSDDVDWCKANFAFHENNFTLIDFNKGEDSWKDMYLMSVCKHHIIANSSFSWWGAWLNPSREKIVIAPKKWFADEERNRQSENIIPISWIRL